MHVVYITFYRGNLLPPFYVGYSTEIRISKGYNGTVTSQKYKAIWRRERITHPELFKTVIIQRFETVEEARAREEVIHRFFNVPRNPMFINMAIGNTKFGFINHAPKTEEHKQKIREARIGQPSSSKGKRHTQETLQKMRHPHKSVSRRPMADSTKKKIGDARRGKKRAPFKRMSPTEETRQRIRESKRRGSFGVAQLVEQRTVNARVASSSLASGAILFLPHS